jgi:hypothetical protein
VLCFFFIFWGGGDCKKPCDWQPLVAKHALWGFYSWDKNKRRIPAFSVVGFISHVPLT